MAGASSSARTARRLALAAAVMFGFGFALVPVYNVACDALGINGRAEGLRQQTAEAPAAGAVDRARTVTVEFVASTAQDLPWQFEPSVARMQVHPGELAQTTYRARNLAARRIVGQAVPSVAPGSAAKSFHKLECFCFTRQPLAAGEAKDMPVRFRLDPQLDPSVRTVTLSYTFFEAGESG